jgi:hypothetical protein
MCPKYGNLTTNMVIIDLLSLSSKINQFAYSMKIDLDHLQKIHL